ncbi:MAG: PSD1 domain-containing protein [Acidobacteria bacterium]|nr:PSD1 domain-containing protein [Acidobacteriota bacterium]MBI3422502.1 PSD1 domain-containing protein [Acidobacteriota bacterium]
MRHRKLSLSVVSLFLALVCGLLLPSTNARQQSAKVDFARDIQPIFQTHCAGCHGAAKQMAQLRLDNKQIASRVISPGDSAASRLLKRLTVNDSQHGEPRMPKGGEPLKPEQIALIKRWIDEGADWPEQTTDLRPQTSDLPQHWAFVPPVRPALPTVKNKLAVKNAIDAFVLARLEKEGLTPSPAADRVTLLRRLSLDLIGLPPTPEEVDAFVRDLAPNAYEKQVERLLASPHYGERWGRLWLDAARYSDSDGYEKDKPRFVWFYRDWVINALNRDLPYDQFIIEQIAGDLLPNPTQDQLVATGFLRNSMINEEGGVDPEQFRMEAMFDRMDAIGKGMLGITIQCAQCHNHKFDPLKQEEYYRLFAFLNNSHESNVVVYTPPEQMQRANILSQTREIEARLQETQPDWLAQMNAWEDKAKQDQPTWQIVQPAVDDISTGGAKYFPLKDGSFLQQGYAPTKHRVKLTIKTDVQNITAFRLELLNDPNLPANGPGRSILGTGALTEFEVETAPVSDPKKITKVKFTRATADINLPEREILPMYFDKSNRRRVEGPIEFAIDGNDDTAWGHDAGPVLRNLPRKAVFVADKPISNDGGTLLTFYLKQNHGGWNSDDNQNNNLGRFRLSFTTAANATADPLPANVRELITNVPREQRSKAQVETIFSYWRTTVPAWQHENEMIAKLWQTHPAGATQLVLNERGELRPTFTLKRGDFLRPDKEIQAGVPAFLNPLPANAPVNRLTFAKWLVDRQAPTTARSLVNRVWQTYFGTGLVASSEDLGKQSDAPSHPELLDWLAVELMEPSNAERGMRNAELGTASSTNTLHSAFRIPHSPPWSLKHLHRLIVNSATYRQSSSFNPQSASSSGRNPQSAIRNPQSDDPYNRLLARGPRFRVDGEIVRDIALATSGLLNEKIGGPSVYPPSPEFLYLPPASYGPKIWKEEKGADRYRRGLYTFRYRSVPYPVLQNFDVPNGDIACVRRSRSNTPLQALTTLNETLFLEAARALAVKTIKEGGATNAQRLTFAFRRVLSRKPTLAETNELLSLWKQQHERFLKGAANPWNLATNDPDKPFALPANTRMEDLAAWTAVARVLLNLDEAITKE